MPVIAATIICLPDALKIHKLTGFFNNLDGSKNAWRTFQRMKNRNVYRLSVGQANTEWLPMDGHIIL